MENHLHIISFDIPFPANYGGAIDVFHKIRCLHEEGINVILHCFEYGDRGQSIELEKLCKKVYYYKRNTSFRNQLSFLPYNVKSRTNDQLKRNLLKDNYSILFEVLHTCYLINDPQLKNRFKIYRHSNIEHEYFKELAKAEKSFLKKIYFNIEAIKLKWFEKNIKNADVILSVSKTDLNYFKKNYPTTKSYYLPSFNEFDEIEVQKGIGNYILYHGNLSISENYTAAIWLIENVFSKINYPVIIAGLNPPSFLTKLIESYKHITLKENCNSEEINQLISEAQIHCLYTAQATGLKLKLLNVLYKGRHIIVNKNMLVGTDLGSACSICNTADEYITTINLLLNKPIESSDLKARTNTLEEISNKHKTQKILDLLCNKHL